MQTLTLTQTYTVVDIRRVLDNFAADFAMIAQATGLRTRESVDNIVADLKEFATVGYIQEIHISLSDAAGKEIRAACYVVSTTAEGWRTQLPGNNLWPRTPGGNLSVVVRWSQKYLNLDDSTREQFRQRLRTTCEPSSLDLTHSSLTGSLDRYYASNGWGLAKKNFQ